VDAPLEALRRWEDSGGTWRVVARGRDGLEIVLLTCTGDEEMGRIVSADAGLAAFVGDRGSSED
jgi:hypothetical protein